MLTHAYATIHEALTATAARHGLTPIDVRVLVALWERGHIATSHELERDLLCQGSQVRRASLTLRKGGFVRCDSGPGTAAPRRGTVMRLQLLRPGRIIAEDANSRATFNQTDQRAA